MAGPHPPNHTVGGDGPHAHAESQPSSRTNPAGDPAFARRRTRAFGHAGPPPPVSYPKRRSKRRLVIGLLLAIALVAALTVAIVYGVRTNGANTGAAFSEGAAKTAIQGYLDALEHRDIDEHRPQRAVRHVRRRARQTVRPGAGQAEQRRVPQAVLRGAR